MYAALSSFKSIAKLSVGGPTIENLIFKLHGRLTVLLLIIFSGLITTELFFGNPISCFTSVKDEIPEKYVNAYCWMHSTFTLADEYHKEVGGVVIAPGVAKAVPGDRKIWHSYYQWVGFFLFFSGITFYIPHFLWKLLEGNKMEKTLLGLDTCLTENESERDSNVFKLAEYLKRSQGMHTRYALAHAACEALNLLVVISQIFLTDAFLGGEFTTYGTDVVSFGRQEFKGRTDPMVRLFPRVTKCSLHRVGPSGSLQNHDALCVLPINVANEKIFVFLWFWYVLLAVTSGMAFLYRILLMVFGDLRLRVLRCGCRRADQFLMERLVLGAMDSYGDWFVLRMMESNLSDINFCKLVEELGRIARKDAELMAGNYALVNCRNIIYQNGDTMPMDDVRKNLCGTTKVRISSLKPNKRDRVQA